MGRSTKKYHEKRKRNGPTSIVINEESHSEEVQYLSQQLQDVQQRLHEARKKIKTLRGIIEDQEELIESLTRRL